MHVNTELPPKPNTSTFHCRGV